MADLIAILNNSATGLSAHQAAAATSSHNLQNANTPGFSRQRAELQANLPAEMAGRGQIGRGVSLLAVTQARDKFVERQMPTALSSEARSSSQSFALKTVNAMDPDAAGGITGAMGDFYAALRTTSQNPGEPGLRAALVSAGRALGFAFNRTAGSLAVARDAVDTQIEGLVTVINDSALAVSRLNKEIRGARAAGVEPNDLLDVRQKHLDTLAQLTGANQLLNGNGDVSVVLASGASLVTGSLAASLEVQPQASNGGHLALRILPPDGSGAVLLSNDQISGQAGGLLEARDGAMKESEERLDQLAFDLASNLNTVHQGGFGLDGTTGDDFFDIPPTSAGAAKLIAVDAAILADPRRIGAAASAATLPGSAVNLQAMAATEQQVTTSGADPGKTFGRIAADYGAATSAASAMAEQDGILLGHLKEVRESVSGVSIDEEIISLTKSQRAYEAVMKVLSTADQMLETLLNLK